MSRTKFFHTAILLLVLAFGSAAAWAQSETEGAIGGTIVDQQGAVVPNAKVTVTNSGTNQPFVTPTSHTGAYRATPLQPGIYEVKIDAAGFTAYDQKNVVVEIGRITTIDPKMSVTAGSETVTVSSEAPTVNVEQQDFATNVNQTSINELPINGRRWSNFALLTPGANPDGGFGLISFRGVSGLLNNNTVDGGDNNQAFFSEEKGRTRISYAISQAAVQEF